MRTVEAFDQTSEVHSRCTLIKGNTQWNQSMEVREEYYCLSVEHKEEIERGEEAGVIWVSALDFFSIVRTAVKLCAFGTQKYIGQSHRVGPRPNRGQNYWALLFISTATLRLPRSKL